MTIFEKIYIYVKLLFESYEKIVTIDPIIGLEEQEEIKKASKNYIQLLIKKNPYCIYQLLSIYKNFNENILYEIVIFVMKLYYENGIKILNSQNNRKNFRARNEFINCMKLGKNFIEEKKLILLKDLKEEYDNLNFKSNLNINKIESSIKINIEINENYDKQNLFKNDQFYDKDNLLIILGKYRKALENTLNNINNINESCLKDSDNLSPNEIETESFLLANIVKIKFCLLQSGNHNILKKMAEQSVNLSMSINKNWDSIPWFREIKTILEELRARTVEMEAFKEKEFKKIILEREKEIFDEIKEYSEKTNIEFIKFIIEKHPPRRYKKPEKTIEQFWEQNKENLIDILCAKYHPTNYPKNTYEEQKKYVIAEKISEHLNHIYQDIKSNNRMNICEDDD